MVNSEILWLADKDLSGLQYLDLYFTDELPEQIAVVAQAYKHPQSGNDAPKNRTNGLYFKGGLS